MQLADLLDGDANAMVAASWFSSKKGINTIVIEGMGKVLFLFTFLKCGMEIKNVLWENG